MNETAGADDRFGWSVAAADFNGDGFDDLAIGVPFEDMGDHRESGAIQVIYGGSGGLFAADDQVFTQNTSGMNDTAEAEDFFGSNVTSGDHDGNGFDDLVVGVRTEGVSGAGNLDGAVQAIYGTSVGLSSSGDQVLHQDTPGMYNLAEVADRFGWSLVLSPDIFFFFDNSLS